MANVCFLRWLSDILVPVESVLNAWVDVRAWTCVLKAQNPSLLALNVLLTPSKDAEDARLRLLR